MAYHKLDLDCQKWPHVEWFVREGLEGRYFVDIHHMLRLPLKEKGIDGGCNFSVAHTLLAALSGISTTLYTQRKNHYQSDFKNALRNFYPWDDEEGAPLSDGDKDEVIDTLWDEFRGVLTHHAALPMHWDRVKEQWAPAEPGYTLGIKRWVKTNRNGLSEAKIRRLETSKTWPFPNMMTRTVVIDQDAKVLKIERLYWGVRRMVEQITRCEARMRNADQYLGRDASRNV